MAYEITNAPAQTVAVGQNVLFTATPVGCTKGYVIHRDGSGIVTLRGIAQNCFARYKITFDGNLGIPTGGAAGAVSIAITINGEPVPATTMTVTPAAVATYFSVSKSVIIDVPRGCCYTISVENTSGVAVSVTNANLLIDRIA